MRIHLPPWGRKSNFSSQSPVPPSPKTPLLASDDILRGALVATALFVFSLAVLKLRRRRAPSWRDIDPAILKVGGTRKRLEAVAEKTDVVLIGSGLGSLTSAALLSKAGYKVVILEQHDVAGGATHTFEGGGFEFDVGIHYLGGRLHDFTSPVRRLWSAVSDGKLEWTPSDEVYDVCFNSKTDESIPFIASPSANSAAVLRHFQAKKANTAACKAALSWYRIYQWIGWFVALAYYTLKALPPAVTQIVWPLFGPVWRRFGSASVKDILDRCGCPAVATELSGVLTYLYGDYGVTPTRAPWFLHALVSTHYDGGSFFPTGGSASIAKTIVSAITSRGGHVFVRSPVDEIVIENGRAVGVRLKGDIVIRAKVGVISGAGFRNTFGCADAKGGSAPLLDPAAAAPQRCLLQVRNASGSGRSGQWAVGAVGSGQCGCGGQWAVGAVGSAHWVNTVAWW